MCARDVAEHLFGGREIFATGRRAAVTGDRCQRNGACNVVFQGAHEMRRVAAGVDVAQGACGLGLSERALKVAVLIAGDGDLSGLYRLRTRRVHRGAARFHGAADDIDHPAFGFEPPIKIMREIGALAAVYPQQAEAVQQMKQRL
jgi:hypothetical protein